MPSYDYNCAKCKVTYELREGFDAPTTHRCQECGKGTAKRVLHAPRVVFKGSGWYATDSRQKSTAISDSGESGDGGGESDSSDGKTESKPAAAKSESKPESKAPKKESNEKAPAAAS